MRFCFEHPAGYGTIYTKRFDLWEFLLAFGARILVFRKISTCLPCKIGHPNRGHCVGLREIGEEVLR